MKYKVLTSFSGAVSASTNSVISLDDEVLAKDLLNAGYIEAVQENTTPPATNTSDDAETDDAGKEKKSTKKQLQKRLLKMLKRMLNSHEV